jgi:Protein of unknown function (DUF1761)
MQEITANVSWLAVVTGAIAAFVVGWIWYSPRLFGKGWAAGSGVQLDDASQMPVAAMLAQVIGLLLMSWFVAVTAANGALATVILATLAFTALAGAGAMFSGKNAYARHVDAGFWLVALAIMIAANAIF